MFKRKYIKYYEQINLKFIADKKRSSFDIIIFNGYLKIKYFKWHK